MASGVLRVVPGTGGIAGVPLPGWASVLLTVVLIIAALAVLLVILRNRRR